MNSKDFIDKAVRTLTQIDSLSEDLKGLKDEGKEAGLNVAALITAAKAVVANKVDELTKKSEDVLEALEVARS